MQLPTPWAPEVHSGLKYLRWSFLQIHYEAPFKTHISWFLVIFKSIQGCGMVIENICSFVTKAADMIKTWKLLVLFHLISFFSFEEAGTVSDNLVSLKSECLKPIKYLEIQCFSENRFLKF